MYTKKWTDCGSVKVCGCVVYLSSAVVSQEPYVSDGAVLCIIYPPFHKSSFITKNLEIIPNNIFEQVLYILIFLFAYLACYINAHFYIY